MNEKSSFMKPKRFKAKSVSAHDPWGPPRGVSRILDCLNHYEMGDRVAWCKPILHMGSEIHH